MKPALIQMHRQTKRGRRRYRISSSIPYPMSNFDGIKRRFRSATFL